MEVYNVLIGNEPHAKFCCIARSSYPFFAIPFCEFVLHTAIIYQCAGVIRKCLVVCAVSVAFRFELVEVLVRPKAISYVESRRATWKVGGMPVYLGIPLFEVAELERDYSPGITGFVISC